MDFKNAKKIIEENQSITLFPSLEFERDTFPATLSLFYSLKELGKDVNIICKDLPKKFDFLIKEQIKTQEAINNTSFLISIKETETKLAQIFYQKKEKEINLFLKTNQGELKKEDINFKSLTQSEFSNMMSDFLTSKVLVTIGVEQNNNQFSKQEWKSIINIDNNPENKNYGDINLIQPDYSSVSEVVFDLLKEVDENLFKSDISNPLLAGIIQETSNFHKFNFNADLFQKIYFLMKKEANWQEIVSNLYNFKTNTSTRLLGRTLNKLNFSEEKNLNYVFLAAKDFQETNSSYLDLPFVFKKITSLIFPFQNFLCLWKTASSLDSFSGVFYSCEENLLGRIQKVFHGEKKGHGALFKIKDTDPLKVKDKVLNLI